MNVLDNLESQLFVEAYAPKKVADCILPKRIKEFLQNSVDQKNIFNYIAVGSAGVGKTSSAKAMLNELGVDYLIINASKDGNIDMIRNKIQDFATKMTLNDFEIKCIILDEVDGVSSQYFFTALRGVIEEFQSGCRFIFTANDVNKIPEAIKSRCPVIDFTYSKEENTEVLAQFFKRVKEILDTKEIKYDKRELMDFCMARVPDLRSCLNTIQHKIINGVVELKGVGSTHDDKLTELVGYLKAKEFSKMRKWVADSLDTPPSAIRQALYSKMYDLVDPSSIPPLVLIINEYDYKEAFVVSREINLVACLTNVMQEIEFK